MHEILIFPIVPTSALSLSIVPTGNQIAGSMYELECSATIVDGIQSTPIFTWLDSDGNRIMSGNGLVVGPPTANTLPLDFNILTGSHSGTYTCNVTLFSLALQDPITASTSININVQRKSIVILLRCVFLHVYSTADNPISVTIASIPAGPEINAAESLTVTCQASGGTGTYNYQWSSTCTGGCFLNSGSTMTSSVTRNAARSSDSGLYTCTVTDNAGNSGTNSTEIEVVGMYYVILTEIMHALIQFCNSGVGFYLSGIGSILNNSILETDSEGRIPQLYCLSGSNMSIAGEWVSPQGQNLTAVQNDPFDITFGANNNPGQLLIETPTTNPPIAATHEGVYSCVIPDETGQSQSLYVGLYLSASKFK